ncbi:MAG TPA: DUF2071 domain-containing protein [Candidatus Polarisedimenticolia bacterium]|nr:DUF2071 domain-containing protein [Candidatus Polarisedimenticolia bacterium]
MSRKMLFVTAACRDLAILNYEVDRAVLAGRVPPGCELDDWQGKHFVTIMGLRFLRPRLLGVSLPFLAESIEVNFGFHVRRHAGSAWRRGIALIKELSSGRLFAFLARNLFGDGGLVLPMRHAALSAAGHDGRLFTYGWRRRGAWESLSVRSAGPPIAVEDESEEAFLLDRYWGFTQKRGSTYEFQIEHPRWRLFRGDAATLEADIPRLFGPEFMEALSFPPRTALTADGSSVTVRQRHRIG